jgi:hypothetical protein
MAAQSCESYLTGHAAHGVADGYSARGFTRMPVNIYRVTPDGQNNEDVAWLCDDKWRLPDQVDALELWLTENRATLRPDNYVADIGFTPRVDALGGGAAISPELMRTMADLGMSLFLSEYPASADESAA